jgi:prolyl 4-hydroxylase
VSSVVRFSLDLSAWLVSELGQGRAPLALVETMIAERMEPAVASAIVAAFVAARRDGRPVPVDSLLLENLPAPFRHEAPRLAPGLRLAAEDREVRVVMRRQRPCLAVLEGLLNEDERGELMEIARPRLTPSTLVDPETGLDVVASERTSFGMFFRPRENALVARLDRRFSEVMGLPEENGEGLQVLRYPNSGESKPHFDFLRPTNDANRASLERSG